MEADRMMKLADALSAARRPARPGAKGRRLWLGCGFTPLHFKTYLAAYKDHGKGGIHVVRLGWK